MWTLDLKGSLLSEIPSQAIAQGNQEVQDAGELRAVQGEQLNQNR